MASETRVECSLNTTECILETIVSILSEIQDQNSEYNWDPVTFVFTAIIGVIALVFSALAVLQALLAAGPGRTRSGAYAIGPWSRFNVRKFDWVDMRFRTTSSTPILTVDTFYIKALDGKRVVSIRSYQNPKTFRKGQIEDFPAKWLALLTVLHLDEAKLWETRLTGADYIPAEFSAVPAYGSIRFVTTLSIILSRGTGRLIVDRESGLPRVQGQNFTLIFRQHPLLGTVGSFEMYGEMSPKHSLWRHEISRRLLQADGHMDVVEDEPESDEPNFVFRGGKVIPRVRSPSTRFADKVRQGCSHGNLEPKLACYKLLDRFADYQPNLDSNGPLQLLAANVKLLPFFFPHKKARLREKLDTLLLQSRFWATESSAYSELSSNQSADFAKDKQLLADKATSWAQSTINPAFDALKLRRGPYALCLAFLADSDAFESNSRDECIKIQEKLQVELASVESWLQQAESHVLCRKLILTVVGDGIHRMIRGAKQHPNIATASRPKDVTLHPSPDQLLTSELHRNLCYFLDAMSEPNSLNYLYPLVAAKRDVVTSVRLATFECLAEIRKIWELKESSLEDGGGKSGESLDGDQQHKGRSWKLPNDAQHPLDDLLIYRAVLMTLLYSLSVDSSVLLDEDSYGLVVPIM